MGTTELLKIVTPDAPLQPVVHEDLIKIVRQSERYSVIPFANETERTAVYTILGITPHKGAISYLQNRVRNEFFDGTQWVPETGTILAYGERTSDKVFTGTEIGVLRLDGVQMFAGYRYIIRSSVLGLSMSTSGDTGQAFLRYRTDNNPAGTGDTIMQQADVNANSTFVARNSCTFSEPYVASANGTLSVLLSLGRSGGAGNITMSGSATRPIRLYIEQGGKDPGDTGVAI